MARAGTKPAEALLEQSRTVHGWLADLTDEDFSRATVLPGWDLRLLTGHLVMIHTGFTRLLDRPTGSAPVPLFEWVRRYRRDVDQIQALTAEAAADRTGPQLVDELGSSIEHLAARLSDEGSLPLVINSPRGATSLADFTATRIVDLVVHADDLSRSLPEREPVVQTRRALGICSRTLTAVLAGQHPGRSIEVRIPPYAAVQCGIGDPGPTHTRGTPPNVVETDAVTFLRMATGRTSWEDSVQTGKVAASGLRANLSGALPLLS